MSKDIVEKRLEEHNDVFVDIFNNLLFSGKKLLKEEYLTNLPTESYVRDVNGKMHQKNRDVSKAAKNRGVEKIDINQNVYRLVCGLENQSGKDNTMPERVMGYDYAAYEMQIKEIMTENANQKRPAYTKRIHDDQKLAPVVTGVLHWGPEEWDGPMRLHDMLRFPEDSEDILKPLVPDYPINLIEMRKLPKEIRELLTSDFRLIAEYVACGKDSATLEHLMADNKHMIKHPEEFLDMLSEVANDTQYKKVKELLQEETREEMTMCVIADKLVGQGIQQGKQQGIQQGKWATIHALICKGILKPEDTMEFLNMSYDALCQKIQEINKEVV